MTEHAGADTQPSPRSPMPADSLSTSFGAFRSVTTEQYHEVLTEGLIVLATDVLLNLYRYTPEARADFLRALHALRDQLWIPHQVAEEFWKNRETAITDAQRAAEETNDALKVHFEQIDSTVRAWVNRASLQEAKIDAHRHRLSEAAEALQAEIARLGTENGLQKDWMTADPILEELEVILDGRVGRALQFDEHAKVAEEGARRIDQGIPPGYMDRRKRPGNDVGDYILWEQTLREAESRGSNVLIVTSDTKADWWRTHRGRLRGPRPELYEELRSRCGKRLFILRPQIFLEQTNRLLEISVSETTITQVRNVENIPF